MAKMLLMVDPQIDFITGGLPVPQADKCMDALAQWLKERGGQYVLKLVTLDWHPDNHCSFKANGGQWPRHCVAWSQGAAIWPNLEEALYKSGGHVQVECKGCQPDREEYSIFANSHARAAIETVMAQYGIDYIDICGLAGDICVLNTLKDGRALYGDAMFHVLPQFSPSLDGGKALREFMRE